MILSRAASSSSSSSSSSAPKSFDRALGLVISLAGGAGLYLLHAWLQSLRARKRKQGASLGLGPGLSLGPGGAARKADCSPGNGGVSECVSGSGATGWTDAADHSNHSTDNQTQTQNQTQPRVLHSGSCHCGRFHFRVLAPEELHAVEYSASSKLRFPRLTLSALDFEIVTDESSLSLYSVTDGCQVGIHAFCSFCGMQVLYSPPPAANPSGDESRGEVVVNTDCLDRSTIRQLHVAYGGHRNTIPCVIPTQPHSRRPKQQHEQPQPRNFNYPNADHFAAHRQPSHASGVLVKAQAAVSSHYSDSSGTRALTVSSGMFSEEGVQLGLDDDASTSSSSSCINRDLDRTEVRGGDRERDRDSVELLRHLLHEGGDEGAQTQISHQNYYPTPLPRQHQQWQSAPSETPSHLGSRLLARQQEEAQTHLHSQISHSARTPQHNGPQRTLSSSSLKQLGHSPSLYDTLPLMYNYASTATSPLEQQQHYQHQHLDAPVMIRGAELAGPTGLLGLELRSRGAGISPGHSSSTHSTPTSLHQRLKLYLQQHLDEA
jgi:hypothetical protein